MKRLCGVMLTMVIMGIVGCAPNLVVKEASINPGSQTVSVIVENIGNEDAGPHLTYIEINKVDALEAQKPQSQYSANVTGIPAGGTWEPQPIPFGSFSTRGDMDLTELNEFNLVVRADAKGMVKESNEDDNLFDANF